MRRKFPLVVALAAMIMALTAGTAMAGPSTPRPFKAEFSGATSDIQFAPGFDFVTNPWATGTFDGRCPGGASWVIYFAGSGQGTHLGRFTWTSGHCSRVTSLTPPNVEITDGQLQFVTANGDVLDETYVAAGPLTPVGDQVCADTAATFIGGTGRFANASGSALEHGCWPATEPGPVLTDLHVSSAGTISYNASDRSTR
jgi:hypothetical protein